MSSKADEDAQQSQNDNLNVDITDEISKTTPSQVVRLLIFVVNNTFSNSKVFRVHSLLD